MKACLKCAVVVLSLLALGACQQSGDPFVRVEDTRFTINGEPYYYFGANFWHGAYLGADLVEGDRARLVRELELLKSYNITNLRVMAATEETELKMAVRPAFIHADGSYNERLLEGLDFMLSEMGRLEMKAVLVLNNYWQWSGGMAQYESWETGEAVIDPDLTGDWHGFQHQSAAFYADEAANERYRAYISMLINRENTCTGTFYRDDPVIMSWQLGNEPRPAPDVNINPRSAEYFARWVDETAAFIQELDPNHLVSTGNEGEAGCRGSSELYLQVHRSPHVDYLTFHIWPKNWGWFDALRPGVTFDQAVEFTMDYFADHNAMARELNKPTVLEEFGMERDRGSFDPASATTYRDRYLEKLFSAVVDSALAGSPMAGLNFWAWGGEGRAAQEDYFWKEGDSFMGDPPQEAQGLNSVFSTDRSTLEIFSKYNQALPVQDR